MATRPTPRDGGVGQPPGGSPGPSCYVEPETRYALSNRNAILCMGSVCPGPLGTNLGRFRIDDGAKRASLRFTSAAGVTIRAVWLYVSNATTQGRMRVSLKDDVDGRPAAGPTSSTSTLRLRPGWQRVDLPANGHKLLASCSVYHVLLEPEDVELFGGPNYVELITTVSRFPVPFQPRVPGSDGLNSFCDLELAFLFEDSAAGLLVRWEANHFNYGPIFVLEAVDGSAFGQPYNDLLFPSVVGDGLLGEKIPIPAAAGGPVPVNYVAVFAQRRQLGQSDKLVIDIYDETAQLVVSTANVPPKSQWVINRAHWFGAALPGGGVSLFPERSYYLLLRSDNSGPNPLGFETPSLRSTLRLTPGVEDPTYGGAAAHLVFSPNGGESFFATAGRPDMPLLLAQRADPAEVLAIYDEGGVYHQSDDTAALTAAPGEAILVRCVIRNIGITAGNLFVQLVDVETGDPLTQEPVFAVNTPPNTDAHGALIQITAPAAPGRWRIDFRCGHVSPSSGDLVFDDVVRFEVRVI